MLLITDDKYRYGPVLYRIYSYSVIHSQFTLSRHVPRAPQHAAGTFWKLLQYAAYQDQKIPNCDEPRRR